MRQPLLLSLAAVVGLSSIADLARAADEESPETVVISATHIPTPEEQVASSVTVVTADDIAAQQQQTLPDVLKDVPGLNLVQTGGPGGTTTVFIRGANSNHTKVLVDGIDVSDPSNLNATFDFAHFLAQDIERVEILRGPQSGLYGSDAIGGVVSITTKSGSGPLQLAGSVQGGSFDTFNQTGSIRGSAEQFHYSANIEHFHSGAVPVTPLDLLRPGERRNDDYYDNLTASTKLGFDVTQNFDLGLVARYTNAHLRNTGDDYSSFPSFPAAEQSRSDTNEYYARGTVHLVSLEGFLDQTLGVAYTRKRTDNLIPQNPESLDAGERTKIDWQGMLRFSGAETLVLGAEHARDEITDPISAAVTVNSGYAELQSQFTRNLYTALNVRYDHNDQFGGKVTYRVAPAYLIEATGTKVKASFGTGFKAPTLGELYQNYPPYFFGNPNLKSEDSRGYDFGVEQGLVRDTVRFGVTYFYNRINNLIDTDVTGTTYANIGRATTDGIESFMSYQPVKELTLRLDYTYTEATDDILRQELLRRPKHKGSVSAAWRPTSALSLNATVLAVGSWIDGNRDFSIPRLTAAGYAIVNLAAGYDLNTHFTLFGRIDNLFDRRYQSPVGFLQPSIGVFAGIKAKL